MGSYTGNSLGNNSENFLIIIRINNRVIGVYNYMKILPAIIIALLMTTGLTGIVVFMGANALLNPFKAPVANAPKPTTMAGNSADAQQQQAINQLVQQQQLVNQYQQREKQYQDELKQAADRLNQANQQLAQTNQTLKTYQTLIQELQQAGIIAITRDGRVMVPQGQLTSGASIN